jgi:hypothetical protein
MSLTTSSNKELATEMQLIQSRMNSYGTELLRSEFIMEDKGLGSLPLSPSVGSLLLFNSNTNPYKNYQALDNLVSSGRFVATLIHTYIYINS